MRGEPGGIAGLYRVLERYRGAVDFDLGRYRPGARLRDLWDRTPGKRLTHRELIDFLQHLPRDSATGRAVHGDAAEWSVDTYLNAAIVDLLAGANWQRGGGKGRRPKPIRRPGPPDADDED